MILNYLSDLVESIALIDFGEINAVTEVISKAAEAGNSIWLIGNGGAAGTANHMQNDLIKFCGIKAISLASNVETLLAYGNDCGFRSVFNDQLDVLARDGDVIIMFSASGKSDNLRLHNHKVTTIGIFGNPEDDDRISCDYVINAPSDDTQIIEDIHSIVMHLIIRKIGRDYANI